MNDTAWPPAPLAPLFDMVGEASAWWEGDARGLTATYGAKVRSSQFAGGVVGAASRFFWGKPTAPNQSGKKLHLPLAADIASTVANLLFETAPSFKATPPVTAEKDSEEGEVEENHTQRILDELLNSEQFGADLLVAAESASALGGVYWRIQWDQSISPHPWITWVDADSAIPEFRYGRMVAVNFVEELARIDEKYTHRLITRYDTGRIDYQLMRGKDANLGEIVPLTEHPATAGLVLDQNSGISLGAPILAAGYIPNALPNPGFRKNGLLRNLGRPDLSPDLFDLFDLLDETWTSLQRELRLGRMRITAPDYMLEKRGMGQGTTFDVDREVYDPMYGVSPEDNPGVQFHQPDLRVEKHLQVSNGIVREVLRRVNISASTFGLDDTGTGAMTAREIEAKTKQSVQTWKAKSRYWKAGLLDAARALVTLAGAMERTTVKPELITIDMAPPVQETMLDKAQTIQALDTARAISTGEKIRMIHPEWDSVKQDQEIADILAETGAPAGDPFLTAPEDGLLE
ncbi:phage portal protein [Corynebacterium dentalis]|uniref:phage portal protein n=1 Tax=Corynebacterium dentalis TaxID=2014528 RepID=UPI00370D721A